MGEQIKRIDALLFIYIDKNTRMHATINNFSYTNPRAVGDVRFPTERGQRLVAPRPLMKDAWNIYNVRINSDFATASRGPL